MINNHTQITTMLAKTYSYNVLSKTYNNKITNVCAKLFGVIKITYSNIIKKCANKLLKAQSRPSASSLKIAFHEQKSLPVCWMHMYRGKVWCLSNTCILVQSLCLSFPPRTPWPLPYGWRKGCLRSPMKSDFLHRAIINLEQILPGEWLYHKQGVWLCLIFPLKKNP